MITSKGLPAYFDHKDFYPVSIVAIKNDQAVSSASGPICPQRRGTNWQDVHVRCKRAVPALQCTKHLSWTRQLTKYAIVSPRTTVIPVTGITCCIHMVLWPFYGMKNLNSSSIAVQSRFSARLTTVSILAICTSLNHSERNDSFSFARNCCLNSSAGSSAGFCKIVFCKIRYIKGVV